MTDSDAVRRVALALPRADERQVRGRWKLKVRELVVDPCRMCETGSSIDASARRI